MSPEELVEYIIKSTGGEWMFMNVKVKVSKLNMSVAEDNGVKGDIFNEHDEVIGHFKIRADGSFEYGNCGMRHFFKEKVFA